MGFILLCVTSLVASAAASGYNFILSNRAREQQVNRMNAARQEQVNHIAEAIGASSGTSRQDGIPGVTHGHGFHSNPRHGNPHHGNPHHSNPHHGNAYNHQNNNGYGRHLIAPNFALHNPHAPHAHLAPHTGLAPHAAPRTPHALVAPYAPLPSHGQAAPHAAPITPHAHVAPYAPLPPPAHLAPHAHSAPHAAHALGYGPNTFEPARQPFGGFYGLGYNLGHHHLTHQHQLPQMNLYNHGYPY